MFVILAWPNSRRLDGQHSRGSDVNNVAHSYVEVGQIPFQLHKAMMGRVDTITGAREANAEC